ncbi:diacylglycerol kinase family lipid kinase [uncultured Acetobacteroides sp.]|uniref:diacylglycerol/lipid kinase family protein n=1 Tax=uncultured Acetobacteroides sp. TaxID=1760811 RepID=UPI0029F46DF3|nr:diacylglycerol kinase family lipid kinase [uncultured Acetobacteroides sp.]
MQAVCFIVNSQKRKVKGLVARIASTFESRYAVMFLYTSASRDAERLAVQAVEQGCSYVVAVGGDGTVNEVVNGLMLLSDAQRRAVTLAVLPWGTGNDFARSIGATPSVERLFELVEQNSTCQVDVGRVQYTQPNGLAALRYFVNIGDVGIGPSTVMMVERLKRFLGATLAFWIGGFCTICFRRPQEVAIEADGYSHRGTVMAVCMANGRYFGSGLGIAPHAVVNDGMLNLVVVGRVSALTFLRFTGKLRRAEPVIHPEVRYVEVSRCRILSESDCPLELDGEVLGAAPLEVELLPGAICVVVDTCCSRAIDSRLKPASMERSGASVTA